MKNTKNNGKMVVVAELASSPVEEWTEWRVYRGKVKEGLHIASFNSEKEANAFVKSHKAA